MSHSPFLNIAIGGPQASGKSSVLRAISQQRPEFDVIYFGEQLPEEFADLDLNLRTQMREKVTGEIASSLMQRDSFKIVDLHYLDLREANPRIQPSQFLSCFDMLIFLELPSQILLDRRMADTGRRDRQMRIADIDTEVDAHSKYREELTKLGFNVVRIDAHEAPLDVANKLLRSIDMTVGSKQRSDHCDAIATAGE